MLGGLCWFCKWWKPFSADLGECSHAKLRALNDPDIEAVPSDGELMARGHNDDDGPVLMTGCNFGCIYHELTSGNSIAGRRGTSGEDWRRGKEQGE